MKLFYIRNQYLRAQTQNRHPEALEGEGFLLYVALREPWCDKPIAIFMDGWE
jgi:hypothetical protein